MELLLKCESCQEENFQTVYLSDEQILTRGIPFSDHKDYIAYVKGKSVCPYCGHVNETSFMNEIYRSNIIDLAIARYKR